MTLRGSVRNPVVPHHAAPCRTTVVAHDVTDQLVPAQGGLGPSNDQPGPLSLLACPDDVMVRANALVGGHRRGWNHSWLLTFPSGRLMQFATSIGGGVRHPLLVAAVVILAACGGGDPVGTATKGSIRGAVADNTGATVPNAAVALTGNSQARRTTNSGADGVYTFADVLPGTYALAVTPPAGFTVGAAATVSVTVASGAQANASAIVLDRAGPDTCAVARPDFGGPATAADRAVFAYDVAAPLNLKKTFEATVNGVTRSVISYDSPDGGVVPGLMVEPVGRSGPRPGVVVMHASTNPSGPAQGARAAIFEMEALAQRGAIVIGIDAPYARRSGVNSPRLPLEMRDRAEHIQLMKDLQRAVDVLLAQANVDPARIGFSGYSHGAMIGVAFAGIERRLEAAVITAGFGGNVTAVTNKVLLPQLAAFTSCAARTAWFRDNVPIEPIRFISGASPTALLFQIARFDTFVLPEDAQAAFDAASSPKEALYYDTGHAISPQAGPDRYAWLATQIGIDP
jgi:dienelactone hydrolase